MSGLEDELDSLQDHYSSTSVYILFVFFLQQVMMISTLRCPGMLTGAGRVLCRNRQETSRLEGELETLRDRYSSATDALVGTNEDRVHLTEQVDELRQQLQKMNDAKNAAQRAAMKQVGCHVLFLSVAVCTVERQCS